MQVWAHVVGDQAQQQPYQLSPLHQLSVGVLLPQTQPAYHIVSLHADGREERG